MLIIVMGLLFIVSAIAATLMLTSRSQIKIEAALSTRAGLETLADSLVRLSAFRLSLQQQQDATSNAVSIDGTPLQCQFGDMLADIRVNDVSGLIDINSAPVDILKMLLRGLGTSESQAARLSAEIQDFRDGDDLPSENGAEASDYQQLGRRHGPKNAPFETIDELDQVLSMTPELLQKLRPFVTVHARSPILDLSVAPLPLLQALARGNNANVAWASVSEPVSREQFQPPAALLTRFNPRSMSKARSRIFAIDVTVQGPNRGRYARHAVIELATQSKTGFTIREWSSRTQDAVSDVMKPSARTQCIQFE